MGVIWGIPYLLIKVAVADLSPASIVFLRTAIGAALLLPVAVKRGYLAPLRAQLKPLLLYTIVEIAIPWVLVADAERRMSSSLAGLLIAAVPLIGALLAWRLQAADRLDSRRVGGLVVGFVGVAVLVGLDTTVRDFGAVGEIVVVSVGYAVGPLIIARRLSSVPAVGVVAASLGLTAVLYAPVGVATLPHHVPPPLVLASVATLGAVCTAVGFVVFFALIGSAGRSAPRSSPMSTRQWRWGSGSSCCTSR